MIDGCRSEVKLMDGALALLLLLLLLARGLGDR
jgi:hypothetical protein